MNISLAAEPIFHIGSFPVTNTLLVAWVIIIFLIVITFLFNKKIATVPKGLQNFLEMIIDGAYNFMDTIVQDKKQTKKFFPIVMTIFTFVILCNWVEIVPGLGTIGVYGMHHGEVILIPFIRATSSDLNFTLAIAIISVLSVQVFGIAALGVFKYGKKFINFKNPIAFFVGILELISEVSKMVSFSFRLFGNIFAGEVLLIVVSFLIPYLIPIPFLFLEIFVGFIQALVFSMLTLVFLKMGVTEHEEH